MTHRVKNYERTIFHPDKAPTSELYPFTEAQAAEIGAILESDGLSLIAAIKLCGKWNNTVERYSKNGKIRVSYSIPFVKKERTDA